MSDVEFCTFPVPNPPKTRIWRLASEQITPGNRLLKYLGERLHLPIPDTFKDQCDMMDSEREQLRTATELAIERASVAADYFNLLSVSTKGFDISPSGANLEFKWGKYKFNDIDYEISCLSFNICIGLLEACSKLSPATELKQLVFTAKAAKSFADKCKEHHRDEFGVSLPVDSVNQIQLEVAGIYYQAQLSVVLSSGKLNPVPGAAMLASKSLAQMGAHEEYPKYYKALALAAQSQKKWALKAFGDAIGYSRAALASFPSDPKAYKKMEEPWKTLKQKFRNDFQPVATAMEHENSSIYFEPITRDLPEVDMLSPSKSPVLGSVKWEEVPTAAVSLTSTLSDGLETRITTRLDEFNVNVDRAMADIKAALDGVPSESAAAATAKHNEVLTKRAAAHEYATSITGLIAMKSSALSQRCPQIFQQFNQTRAAIDQAAQTDVYFETQLAKCQSKLTALEESSRRLEGLRDEILQIKKLAEMAAGEAREAAGGSPSAAMEAITRFNRTCDELATRLNPIFSQVLAATKELKAESEKIAGEFATDIQAINYGFDQGINCYARLVNNLANIRAQIDAV